MSNRYFLKLKVDWRKSCLTFEVYNRKYVLVDDEISWSFAMLQEKLERKFKKMLIVNCERKYAYGKVYYKYTDFKYYELKSFAHFLKALETGKIHVNFQISVYKHNYRFGEIHDRGTSFVMDVDAIEDVFDMKKCF